MADNPLPMLLLIAGAFFWYRTVTQYHSSVHDNVITNVNNTKRSDGDIDNQNPFVPKVIPEELLLLIAKLPEINMALPVDIEALNKALSGIGVDEKSIISILGNSNHEHRKALRQGRSSKFFVEDEYGFERFDLSTINNLKLEFRRFRDAVVLSLLHPWERDARFIEKAIKKGPKHYSIIVEIACTRSSSELLGARKAYHSLFDRSMEEDIAANIQGSERKLLVALVSAYRYEGPKVNEEVAKSEAEILYKAIKNADKRKPIEDEEAIMILATRSKPHLQAVYQHYNKISGKTITKDLEAEGILKDTVECLCTPETYFTRVLDAALSADADEGAKKAMTRVIVSQKGALVKEGYNLPKKVEGTLTGFYKDYMLRMLATGENKISRS